MNSTSVHIAEARTVAPATRGEFERIYCDSFPPSERAEIGTLIADIATGRRRALLASRDDHLVGFALFADLIDDITYLEFLAVDRAERCLGVGGHLMKALAQGQHVEKLLLEVEAPLAVPPSDVARAERERRIAFYVRNGACTVDCAPDYRTPDATGGPPMPMLLLWASDSPPPRGDTLRRCVEALMSGPYALAPGHPLTTANLAGLSC